MADGSSGSGPVHFVSIWFRSISGLCNLRVGSVWFGSGIFGSVCVILFYFEFRRHLSQIKVGALRVYPGFGSPRFGSLFRYGSNHSVQVSFARSR